MVLTMILAAAWGFAEATLFFIVPDVCLTWIALSNRRLALTACGAALGGAVGGGALMYLWGRRDTRGAEIAVDAVPGVTPAAMAGVERALRDTGWLPMFVGSVTGVPYKIYAIKSGSLGLGLATFLVVSLFARSIRFVLLTLSASWISSHLLGAWSLVHRQMALLIVWTAVYVVYFRVKGR